MRVNHTVSDLRNQNSLKNERIASLELALKPLADHADWIDENVTYEDMYQIDPSSHLVAHGITVQHCFDARKILREDR